MASKWYGPGILKVVSGDIDLINDTIKVMLVDSTYTYSAAHEFVADVVADEQSGTGYTGGFAGSGRKTLASKTLVNDAGNSRLEFDFADPVWTAINAGTIGGGVIIKENTNDADSEVIGFLDPADLVSNGGNVTMAVDAQGALQISYL